MYTKRWQRSRKLLLDRRYTMDGRDLSENDNYRVAEVIYLWAHIIQDLSYGSGILTRTCSTRSLTMWLSRLDPHLDIKRVIDTCKCLLSVIREYNPHNGGVGRKLFRRIVLEKVRKEDLVLLEPVWSVTLTLVDTGCEDVALFRAVNTILQFPLRLTLQDVDWVEDKAIADYLEFEKTLTTQTYPEDIIRDMNREAKEVLADFSVDIDMDVPTHGNGATREVKRGLGQSYKYARYRRTYATVQMENMLGFKLPTWLHLSSDIVREDDLAARYVLVPKGIDKKRGVSLEPVTHMFYQQCVFQAMDRHFHRHPELNICLQKQEFNRDLARLGSAILNFGTADLSSASDSVTITLVRKVFQGTPLLPWLLRTRTRYCDVSNGDAEQRVTLEKFAPMGSALCFPVECLIFSLVIRVASKRVGVDRYYRVYGDDMIIHSDVWDEAIKILESLHFIVNMDKSFAPGSEFTESCGIECLNGWDVSPLRVSRKWDPVAAARLTLHGSERGRATLHTNISRYAKTFNSRKRSHRRRINLITSHMSPSQLEGQVEFLNRLLDYGLYKTAQVVYRDIRRCFGDVRLREAEASLQQADPLFRLSLPKIRKNPRTQSLEMRVFTTTTDIESGMEEVNYFRTLETLAKRADDFALYNGRLVPKHYGDTIQRVEPEMVTTLKSGSTTSRVVLRWVPMIV